MTRHFNLFVLAVSLLCTSQALAQNSGIIQGQDTSRRVITTAVPFMMIAPDARHGGMGDVGVATSADANGNHYNPAKLAHIKQDMGFSVSYTPWLSRIINDMSISYLSGYKKIDDLQAVGISMRYFDLGDIQLTDGVGNPIGQFNPREYAIDGTYSRILSDNLSLGITGRFIHSNLSGNIASNNNDARPGMSVAADIGVLYQTELNTSQPSNIAFGASITNIGSKITYNNESDLDFIPTNLRIGTAYTMGLDPYNSLTFAVDFNKLMVPTPFGGNQDAALLSGMFGSFTDAPNGFSEEMQEISISSGVEYWYNEIFSARAGYFYENPNKGNRQYFTLGLGFRYQVFGVDFAYLVPFQQDNPLAETLRFTLLFNFGEDTNTARN